MLRLLLSSLCLLLSLSLLPSCPAPTPQSPTVTRPDVYETARLIVNTAQSLGLASADGAFALWAAFADPDAAAVATPKYQAVRKGIVDGLEVALSCIDTAEKQRQGFDLRVLMKSAEDAWGALSAFLADLGVGALQPRYRELLLLRLQKLPKTLLPE